MSSHDFDQLLGSLPATSPGQLQRLRHECELAAVTARDDDSSAMTAAERADRELQRRLQDAGLVGEIKPPPRLAGPRKAYSPIEIGGEPISEMIVRERR